MAKVCCGDLKKIANQLRIHSITSTTAAGSGHPTTCLSAADIVAVLFFSVMRYFPKDPKNPYNDRFVLSKGHAAPLLYAAWAQAGLFSPEELLRLRKIDSDLEGHPTPRLSFVDVATGSLGQGLSVGVGMALSARLDHLSYRTYVLMGDGEIAEGAVYEAAAMASYYHLDNLVGIIDVNRLGQSQETMYQHDLGIYRERFESFGWQVKEVNGHDIEELLHAFDQAKNHKGQPTMILAKTLKGGGVSFLEDRTDLHGKPLNRDEMEKAVVELQKKAMSAQDINIANPEDVNVTIKTFFRGDTKFPSFSYTLFENVATRKAYGNALKRIGGVATDLVVLDGDVKNSTYAEQFARVFPDRYIECFIAEQNMIGVATGLASRGKVPFVSSFAAFLVRAFDQLRMAGISEANIKLFGSHVGVSIGQDGTSQMGLEDIAMMRVVFGSVVLYPSDAVSMERLVEQAYVHQGIVYLRGTRPDTPVLYKSDEQFPIGGFKILRQSDHDCLTLVVAGVTLHEALKAYDILANQGIFVTVIDLYSIKPLAKEALFDVVRKTNNRVITVEDHYAEGGIGDAVAGDLSSYGIRVHKLAVRELPHSGEKEELLAKYRIDAQAIVETVQDINKLILRGHTSS